MDLDHTDKNITEIKHYILSTSYENLCRINFLMSTRLFRAIKQFRCFSQKRGVVEKLLFQIAQELESFLCICSL